VFSLWISSPRSPSAPFRKFQSSFFFLEAQILGGYYPVFLVIIFVLIVDFCKRKFWVSVIILFCTPYCTVLFHYHTETFKMRQPASFPFTGSGLLRGRMNQMGERSSGLRDSQQVFHYHGRMRPSFGLGGKSLRISSSFHNLQVESDESTSG